MQRRQRAFEQQEPLYKILEKGLNDKTLQTRGDDGSFSSAIWMPDLYFSNAVKQEVFEEWFRVYPYTDEQQTELGTVIISQRMRVRATFAERFELANFPVDRQDLKVKVRSRQEAHLVHFSTPSISDASDRSQVLVDKFVREGEWELSDILRLRVGESRPTESLSQPPKVYPELHLQMRVVRKPWNYLFDVVLPLGLISLGSITSLVVPRADLGDRLAITVTMILTSITFKTITQRTLPVLSYQTLMDYYILTMFVFIFAVLVVNLAFLTPIFEERWQGLLAYPDDLQVATRAPPHLHPHNLRTPARGHVRPTRRSVRACPMPHLRAVDPGPPFAGSPRLQPARPRVALCRVLCALPRPRSRRLPALALAHVRDQPRVVHGARRPRRPAAGRFPPLARPAAARGAPLVARLLHKCHALRQDREEPRALLWNRRALQVVRRPGQPVALGRALAQGGVEARHASVGPLPRPAHRGDEPLNRHRLPQAALRQVG